MFLTDENIPHRVVEFLRNLGFTVFDLREEKIYSLLLLEHSDEEVLRLAKDKNLVLITFDKHFANIKKYPPENYSGIVRIRIHPPILEDIDNALKLLLERMTIEEIRGKLIVLEKAGYRIRKSTQ